MRLRRLAFSRERLLVARFALGALATLSPFVPATLSAQARVEQQANSPQIAEAYAPFDVPAYELRLVEMINALRAERGVAPLAADAALGDLARIRSADMIERNYFGHDIPGVGFAPQWLLDQLPQAFGTGENLGESNEPTMYFLDSLFQAWMKSPSHLENMLQPQFSRIGVGIVETPTDPPGATLKMVTQVFAVADGPLSHL
jgi:uncharacterized protein YkwD